MTLMLEKKLLDEVAMHNADSWIEFHQSLIELRINKGLTQSDVAAQLGISQSAVSQFETLTRTPNLETVFTYALALGAKLHFSLAEDQVD
jgi:transcriptional regulator with XRE-family HTH domain